MPKGPPPKPWSPEEIELALQLYAEMPAKMVAARLGRSTASLKRMVRRQAPRYKLALLNIEQQVRELHAQGLTDGQIAQQLQRPSPSVREVRLRLGLPQHRRPPGQGYKINLQRAQELRAQGLSYAKIAKHFNCASSSVANALRRAANQQESANGRVPSQVRD